LHTNKKEKLGFRERKTYYQPKSREREAKPKKKEYDEKEVERIS
jgi:hypothetical protein